MVAFPAISAVISLVCAGVIIRDAFARPRPDKVAWAIAFTIFAIAAGCEVVASLGEWTPALTRIYYLTGAVLVVGYLALGELYLLAAARIQRFAPGVTLLVTAVAATVILNADVDSTKLADDGWEALERGAALTALAIGINSVGTLVIAGGLVYSAVRFKRLGVQRNRMIGCLLIALGTVAVALGGTVTRLGHREYLYIPMAIGVGIIFAGYLQTRRPDGDERAHVMSDAAPVISSRVPAHQNGHRPAPVTTTKPDSGIEFIEEKLAVLNDLEISELCRAWSVERREIDSFARDEARRAWALRMRLSLAAQGRFDALPLPVRLQLTELYHEVLSTTSTRARTS